MLSMTHDAEPHATGHVATWLRGHVATWPRGQVSAWPSSYVHSNVVARACDDGLNVRSIHRMMNHKFSIEIWADKASRKGNMNSTSNDVLAHGVASIEKVAVALM